ncbi:MAG: glycosyltransferase family 39 protein [candidate division Zixibacteria bacterium]|nr:glycosyltransferase family 39 protein [candidate division Zixibacteria bacterium]
MATPECSRRIPLILAAVCVFMRLVFVFATEPIPVMWDARIYSSAGIGLIHAVSEGGGFGHPETLSAADSVVSRNLFLRSLNSHIRGEKIEWLYYAVPTLAEAQDYVFLSGPVYPAWLGLIFLQGIGGDFVAVRVVNCFLDGLSALLLMLIALRLFGRRAAVIAGVMYILSLPFTLLCGMVSPDQITILLILAALYNLIAWYDDHKTRRIYLTGLFLGLLVLTRPTATLLCLPFLAGFLFDLRRDLKSAAVMTLRALLPYVAVVLPWVLFATAYFGVLTVRDPDYSEANLRSSSSIQYDGYDLDYTAPDFWLYSIGDTIAGDLPGYAHLLIKKFIRLWAQPYNDFAQSFLQSPEAGRIVHVIIVLFGLFGIFYFMRHRRPGPVYLLLIPLYYTIVHMVFHSLARYNLNAMPLVMIASAGAMAAGYDYLKKLKLSLNNGKHIRIAIGVVVAVLLVFCLPSSIGARLFNGETGMAVVLILKAVILIGLFLFSGWLAWNEGVQIGTIRVLMIPMLILLVVITVAGGTSDGWAEWKCRLERPEQKAGVRVYVPADYRLQPNELVRIGIDLIGGPDSKNVFDVTIGDRRVTLQAGKPPLTNFYYKKMTYPVFERLRRMDREQMRFWSFVVIEPETFNTLADRDGYVKVELSASETLVRDGGYIDLFGNYTLEGTGRVMIPDLNYSSIERFVEKGDPRIWVKYALCSDSVVSYYSDDAHTGRADRVDLSPAWGVQSGRYRIYIEAMRLNRTKDHL